MEKLINNKVYRSKNSNPCFARIRNDLHQLYLNVDSSELLGLDVERADCYYDFINNSLFISPNEFGEYGVFPTNVGSNSRNITIKGLMSVLEGKLKIKERHVVEKYENGIIVHFKKTEVDK